MNAKKLIPQWIMDLGLSRDAHSRAESEAFRRDYADRRVSKDQAIMRKWYSESVTSKSWFSRLDNRRFPIRYDCIHEFSHASARHQRRIEIISALLHLDTLMLAKLFVEPFARKRHEQVLAFIGAREMAIVEAAYNTAKTASDK